MAEIRADMAATIWRIRVEAGATIAVGDEVAILESMKMEIPVESAVAGTIRSVEVDESQQVQPGDVLLVVE